MKIIYNALFYRRVELIIKALSKNIYDETESVRLIMKCKTAKDISKINKNEQEVLLKRNTSFKILKKYYVNGKLFIDMEEL